MGDIPAEEKKNPKQTPPKPKRNKPQAFTN